MASSRNNLRLVTAAEARRSLGAHHDDLLSVVSDAHARFVADIAPLLPQMGARGRANAMHELIADEVQQRFFESEDFTIYNDGNRFCLITSNALFVRFKKLASDFLPRTYPTRTAIMFDRQLPLGAVPGEGRITIGYAVDRTGMELQDVLVMFMIDESRAMWNYSIMHEERQTTIPFPNVASAATPPRVTARFQPPAVSIAANDDDDDTDR